MAFFSLENIYERLVIQRIEEQDIPLEDKCELLLDFHCNSKEYYEQLCEYSYLLSKGNCELSLWISLNGKPHISLSAANVMDVNVLEPYEVKISPDDDLINCISVILQNLSKNSCSMR